MRDIKNQPDRSVIYSLQLLVGKLQDERDALKLENENLARYVREIMRLRQIVGRMAGKLAAMSGELYNDLDEES